MKFYTLTLGFMLLAGCVTSTKDKVAALQKAVDGYNNAYRWKNYERAAMYLPSELRATFVATYADDEKSLHVEDFQILRVDMDSENAARVLVRVQYMLLPSVTLESRRMLQHWHRINNTWILETEDNSIRELDLAATPENLDLFGGSKTPSAPADIQVMDPSGEMIRDDRELDND